MADDTAATIPNPEERPLLKIWPETGQMLGLSRWATYEALRRGDLPVVAIGGRRYVVTAELRKKLGL